MPERNPVLNLIKMSNTFSKAANWIKTGLDKVFRKIKNMGANGNTPNNPNGNPSDNGRQYIAKLVSRFVLGTVVLILLSCLAILLFTCSKCDIDKNDAFTKYKDIIGIVLPLLGTWLGTVLAYYFSQSNLEAANKSVTALVSAVTDSNSTLKNIKVNDKDVVIPVANIKYYKYTTKDEMDGKPLKDLITFMVDNSVLRLPFIDSGNRLIYCIHRSIFDKFISIESMKLNATKTGSEFTFKDFLETADDEIRNYINSAVAYLKDTANLYDAKVIMDNNKYCQDVFLTPNGDKGEAITGWVTDVKILEKLNTQQHS